MLITIFTAFSPVFTLTTKLSALCFWGYFPSAWTQLYFFTQRQTVERERF